MGPILGRQDFEFLRPMIERLFGVCSRWRDAKGESMFMELPDELDGVPLKVKYVSQIARAQRTHDLGAFAQTLQAISPLAQVQPEIFDNFNGDRITRDAAGITGLPQVWMNTLRQIKEIRESRAQAAQEVDDEASESQQVDNLSKLATASATAG
jgi:hypothetical protein